MIKKLISYLDYGVFAEISVAIFTLVFIAIVIRTLMISRAESEQQANIVLRETTEKQA